FLYAGATDMNGSFNARISLPTYLSKVSVVGFMSEAEVDIVNNSITHTFGSQYTAPVGKAVTPPRTEFAYVSSYDANGTPLGMDRDIIPTGFMDKINATLPERQSLFVSHPDYLTPDVELNAIIINQETDIWITFVHEGAGYFNSLAYYTYPVGNPPATTADIDTLYVIFPNVSYVGEGGGLVSGDRVFLGHFEVGTVLSWTLVANGWRNGQVNPRLDTWYSNYYLNHNGMQQSIQVWDEEYDKLVFAFEDQNIPSGDNDYNDTVFYLTGNPTGTIDTSDIPPIDIIDDDDGDGISNIFDDFPQDPDRAFETNDHQNSTLAFEDLWPDQGDYDFNDMVLDYNFFYHTAPGNKIRHIIAEFTLKAVGASFQNGFAVQLPMPSGMIESVTIIDGSDPLTYSAIVSPTNFAPFLEANNDGTIVMFNHTTEMIAQAPGHFVNTEAGIAYVTPVSFAVDIKLIGDNILTSDWQWQPPFNPFIFVDGNRGHEVHLADYAPTTQVDVALFGIGDDDTDVPLGRYYRTDSNLPWALNVATSWDHMYEKAEITKGYLKFKSWAESYGTINTDWYEDNPGNRNWEKIYLRP
ncbi:MAG: LruC domain-containing protein, partial [Candidatus Cloacimonetes bacterium]|nr:LruC domain-containing protein [Candidatus Cloacimonadota bacterium]